ncbi:MAG: S41 family peptidase, partial [Pseudomonadota bacterium]
MKLFHSVIAGSLLMVSGCDAAAEGAPQLIPPLAADARMTPVQVHQDVALAKEAFERVHPGYTRYATKAEMDSQWQAIIDRAETQDGMTLSEFYLASELALVAIRCDHTKAELPRSLRAAREGVPLYLPLRWKVIDGRAIVETPGEGTGLQFGDEIVSMDGRPMADVMADVAPYIPVDGYTEWSRAGGIGQSLEFMGGAVDHFGALMWDVPEVARLQVRAAGGEVRPVEVKRIDFEGWSALGQASARNFKDAVTFKRIGENAGYLSVDTFVNYREPVKPSAIYEPVFKAMRDERRDTLILDLRKNGGGSNDASYGLLANLLSEPYRPLKGMFAKTLDLDGIRPHLSTWDSRALNPNPMGFSKQDDGTYALRSFVSDDLNQVEPATYAFGGRLILLTSTTNSSGSTNFAAWMKELGRATTV